MAGRFIARGGRIGRWTLPIWASFTTTRKSGASLVLSSAFHLSQSVGSRRMIPWPEWLSQNPTSAEDIQTVYDVCVQSRVFAPSTQRPIASQGQAFIKPPKRIRWGDSRMLKSAFMRTPGLKPEDWEARNINFPNAVDIARQLQLQNHFSGKDLSDVLKNWSQISEKAGQRQAAGIEPANNVANPPGTIVDRWKTFVEGIKVDGPATKRDEGHEERRGLDMRSGARHVPRTSSHAERKRADQARRTSQQGNNAESIESIQADQARRNLRQRKKAEQASDAEEGIKSKRRPLRLPSTFKGVPLSFDTMAKLRRLERRRREIIVDKEVKQRTKVATIELAQQKRDEARRAKKTMNTALHQQDQNASKERRNSAEIKTLTDETSKGLRKRIMRSVSTLKQKNLTRSHRKVLLRQLKRAEEALKTHNWDAGQGQ